MKPIWTRIAGDIAIVAAWLLLVGFFLTYWAAGLATWQVWGIVLVATVAGCAIGGSWGGRWKKAHPVIQA